MKAGDWVSWEKKTRDSESRGTERECLTIGKGRVGVVVGCFKVSHPIPSPLFPSVFSHLFFSLLQAHYKDLHFFFFLLEARSLAVISTLSSIFKTLPWILPSFFFLHCFHLRVTWDLIGLTPDYTSAKKNIQKWSRVGSVCIRCPGSDSPG